MRASTITIQETTSFNATLKDAENNPFVTFSGSVNERGIPSVSYYISDNNVYYDNTELFLASFTEFQEKVFAEAKIAIQEILAKRNAGTAESEAPTSEAPSSDAVSSDAPAEV